MSSQSQQQFAGFFSGRGFLADYQPAVGVYDEILDADNNLRPHWNTLNEDLGRVDAAAMEHRWKQICRTVHQNGIAYSAYGDPAVRDQHLQIDPLPHLIPAGEWELIEAALKQRADLLNLMLADLYGPRTLVTSGVLPADVLLDHPHYHLPYHDLRTPGDRHLHFYAAQIIRSPRGDWWIKSDRTGAPGGVGFALENRIVISRAFPNEFRRNSVQRLAPFFKALREHLASLANQNNENPHIAILTAGAGSKSYFEDSFLARHLGFTMVETNDLVVRSGSVMLKTLAGLTPVDVIFRRKPDNSLDPLELGGGDPGVPGILQVIRDGNVAIANAPGSGLVESPIFMAFMPRICQALLNTDLLLPGIATWWGGEAESLRLMIDRIDDIHLLPAFRDRVNNAGGTSTASNQPRPESLTPEHMSRDERIRLLQDNPNWWVGQEKVAGSSTAVWDDGNLDCGHISMRTFLTASGDSWQSLPGGFVRVSNSRHQLLKTPFEGGGTKDAWVLSEKPARAASAATAASQPLKPSRSSGFLPSRVADNFCWLGRYLERAAASARLLRAIVDRLTSETGHENLVELPALIRTLALSGQIDAGYAIDRFSEKLPPLEGCLSQLALDSHEAASLRSQVEQVLSLAATVRDRLSISAWRVVLEMSDDLKSSPSENFDLVDLLELIDKLMVDLAAFCGFASDFMTRTHAFRFLNIGRRIEQSLQIIALNMNCFANQKDVPGELMEAVLEISDSGLTYRSRYYAKLQLPTVLDLLIVDELNPRSLAFQLGELGENLKSLPGNTGDEISSDQTLAHDALKATLAMDIPQLCQLNEAGERPALIEFFEKLEQQLSEISVSIRNRYLVHSGPVNQMIAYKFKLPKPN